MPATNAKLMYKCLSHTPTHTHTHMDRHTNLVVSLLSLVVVYFTKWVGWCRIRVSLQCVFHCGYTLLITAVFSVCVCVSVRKAESKDTLEQCVWEVHREWGGPSLNRGNTCLREEGEKTWPWPFVMFPICLPLNTFSFHNLSPPTHMHSRIHTVHIRSWTMTPMFQKVLMSSLYWKDSLINLHLMWYCLLHTLTPRSCSFWSHPVDFNGGNKSWNELT